MQCYREGGCGPYEGRSCTECPASKPDYGKRKKVNMDKQKPLKDWTLEEAQKYCDETECEDCIFDTDTPEVSRCPMAGNPSTWRFIRKPRWTEQEVEDAKTFCRIFQRSDVKFSRNIGGYCSMLYIQGGVYRCLDLGQSEVFPSIRPDHSVLLSEIIGGAAHD